MKWAVTFGQRYNHEEHPVHPDITGASFVVFEGTEEEARELAHFTLARQWAFMYEYVDERGALVKDFQEQIKRHGLVEVVLDA